MPIIASAFRLFLLSLIFCLSISAAPRSSPLYDADGNPSPALLQIFDRFASGYDGSWECIVKETQKKWLRKPNQERWDIEEREDFHPFETFALFSELGMTQTLHSTVKKYDYAVILGATLPVVRNHFYFLKKEWERGIRFQTLIFLTGDRPLHPDFEGENAFLKSPYPCRPDWKWNGELPKNESEMVDFVFDQMELPLEWRSLCRININTPKPAGKTRPNTADTFRFWMVKDPTPGKTLILSLQPFINRQDAIAHNELPQSFEIETVGTGFSYELYTREKRGLAILLDELARWIYEETSMRFPTCIDSTQ